MDNIHISAPPGVGKTSICLTNSRTVLMEGGRVFWVSREELNHERFSQIMSGIPISKASKFHLLSFGDENTKNEFGSIIQQLIRMSTSLESTKLVIIDGWDSNITPLEKKYRLDGISKLAKASKNSFDLYITSLAYENAGNSSEKYKIRAANEFEKMGFENWLIVPHSKNEGIKKIIKSNEEMYYVLNSKGIEFVESL
tara:strand:+ start:4419 stop:5012 length:594 start_codon:yes stop_codon:yes gene_type:complete